MDHYHDETTATGTTMAPMMAHIDHYSDDGHHNNQMHHDARLLKPITTGSMDHMGKMYFHFGYESVVLFEQWSAITNTTMFLSCLLFFTMAIIYELLKGYRRIFSAKMHATQFGYLAANQPTATNQMVSCNCGNSINLAEKNNCKYDPAKVTTNVDNNDDDNNGDNSAKGLADPTLVITAYGSHPSYGMRSTTIDGESAGNGSQSSNNNGQTSSVNPILPEMSLNMNRAFINRMSSSRQTSSYGNHIQLFASLKEMLSRQHLFSTFLYFLQVCFAYYLMLVFMLFNIWFCLAIVFGAALGHFIVAEKNMNFVDHNVEDYCH